MIWSILYKPFDRVSDAGVDTAVRHVELIKSSISSMHNSFTITILLLAILVCPAAGQPPDDPPPFICLADSNWREISQAGELTVYSQKFQDSDVMAFMAVGVLRAPIEQIMEVLRRVEISMDWMPDISEKYTVKNFSDYKAITFSVNTLPWPFADRELLLHNELFIDRKKKYLVVDTFSVELDDLPVRSENVRALMKCGRTLLRPAGPRRTEINLTLLVDPAGDIPVWLVNLLQRTAPLDFLRKLEKKAQSTNFELRPKFREVLNELITLLDRNPIDKQ